LGNLFVAIGNAEPNNKMVLFMTDQKVFIKIFYYCGGSYIAVERQYHYEFSVTHH
jgi:hypothetical protein